MNKITPERAKEVEEGMNQWRGRETELEEQNQKLIEVIKELIPIAKIEQEHNYTFSILYPDFKKFADQQKEVIQRAEGRDEIMTDQEYHQLESLLGKLNLELGFKFALSTGTHDMYAIGLYKPTGEFIKSEMSPSIQQTVKKIKMKQQYIILDKIIASTNNAEWDNDGNPLFDYGQVEAIAIQYAELKDKEIAELREEIEKLKYEYKELAFSGITPGVLDKPIKFPHKK